MEDTTIPCDAEAVGIAGVGHQLQVARHAGLALLQHPAQLHHRQLLAGQQRQNAQPRRLAGGAQGFDSLIGGQRHGAII